MSAADHPYRPRGEARLQLSTGSFASSRLKGDQACIHAYTSSDLTGLAERPRRPL